MQAPTGEESNNKYKNLHFKQVITLEGWSDIMYFVQDSHSFWNWIYFVVLVVVSLVLSALSWYLRSYQYHFKRFCVKALTWQEPCCVIARIVITRTYKR